MKASDNAIRVLHYFEGLRLAAYPDPGSVDGRPWTIGWGHTGPEVVKGLVWSKEKAGRVFADDLAKKGADPVADLVKVSLSQGQFDGLVCFVYNIGRGAFADSTLLRLVNSGRFDDAALQFRRWDKNDGKPMLGLTRRRTAEEALFRGFSGDDAIMMGKSIV